MADLPEFQQKQYAFAAHIRDPENVPAPEGIEDRRMAIYRELFFNNIRNLLSNMFPVLRKLHSDDKWHGMIRQFMQRHRAETPYFLQLPQEFLAFLQHEYEAQVDDYPFLIELAHYEYIELALSISEDSNNLEDIDPDGNLLHQVPVKSALAWVYAYQYPVHRITAEFIPTEPAEQPVLSPYTGAQTTLSASWNSIRLRRDFSRRSKTTMAGRPAKRCCVPSLAKLTTPTPMPSLHMAPRRSKK
jgi:hypothetical protein